MHPCLKRFLAVCMFSFICVRGLGQESEQGNDSAICLKVQGSFENVFDYNNDPYTVKVLKGEKVVDSLTVTRRRKKFTYFFECKSFYTLLISKTGFAPLLIAVDTNVPERK